jgi:hypothetical protein
MTHGFLLGHDFLFFNMGFFIVFFIAAGATIDSPASPISKSNGEGITLAIVSGVVAAGAEHHGVMVAGLVSQVGGYVNVRRGTWTGCSDCSACSRLPLTVLSTFFSWSILHAWTTSCHNGLSIDILLWSPRCWHEEVSAGLCQVGGDVALMLFGSCSDMLNCQAQGVINVVVLIIGGESSEGSYIGDCINVDDGEWDMSHERLKGTAQ